MPGTRKLSHAHLHCSATLTDVSARRYVEMSQMSCEDPYDTTFTFNSLQDSGVYPNE